MDQTRMAKKIYKSKPDGRGKVEKPRDGWTRQKMIYDT
jgi:hypothetical protein